MPPLFEKMLVVALKAAAPADVFVYAMVTSTLPQHSGAPVYGRHVP
jgi:hypothetical protein